MDGPACEHGRVRRPFWKEYLVMRPVKRFGVHKHKSARKFRSNAGTTHRINMKPLPMRGGWRL